MGAASRQFKQQTETVVLSSCIICTRTCTLEGRHLLLQWAEPAPLRGVAKLVLLINGCKLGQKEAEVFGHGDQPED